MESPAWMFTKALSHRQKVLRLYKRASRTVEDWYGPNWLEVRFHKVVLRSRFDANVSVKDSRMANLLLVDGFRELFAKKHPEPFRFAGDPGGTAYERSRTPRDDALDKWAYVEREKYPYYFNRREQRKKELIAYWDKIEKAWDKELESIQKEAPEEDGEPQASTTATSS